MAYTLSSKSVFVFAFCLILASFSWGQTDEKKDDNSNEKSAGAIPSIIEKVGSMEKRDGFFTTYWDAKTGSVFLEIKDFGNEFLYVNSLATGLGSNPVGLDRGQLGKTRVVSFDRVGPKVMLVQRNLRFRALTDNALERRSVEQSFAQSIIWGGKVVAEDEGPVLVDITPWLLSDMHGVIQVLARSDQGDFKLDEKRSAVNLPNCKSFPRNIELEATLTFAGSKPGGHVRETVPTPQSITLNQHHSFIELPDNQYQPRVYDVRSPSISITFADYAAPLDRPLDKKWIIRHRLVKKDPNAELSEPVEPIVYYVDSGAPAQIRDALIEGASWWNEAYEAAGFKNAFQVRVLPDDADPLDVRYNVIQWVHRSTRGWSYGGSVVDPRTGEILKGHVTLGSLRVRQDRLLMESLPRQVANAHRDAHLSCECCGVGMMAEETAVTQLAVQPVDVALARIRQLSAHEVGHTLGFVHNFAGSTYADRASVMDYPAPRIKLGDDNQLDFSDAYAVGIGEWDKVAVQFAYSQFSPDADESESLNAILEKAAADAMIFISDADSRPAHAAHPKGNLWDNGADPIEELAHLMKVRKVALENFELSRLPAGLTSADVEQYLVPVYLHHRYQLQAVGKMIGGVNYAYGYVGDPKSRVTQVPTEQQLAAFTAIWKTIQPMELPLPAGLSEKIGVKPYRQLRDQEQFAGQTGRVFDPYSPARVAIGLALDELLQPQRLARFGTQNHVSEDVRLGPATLIRSIAMDIWNDKEVANTEENTMSQLLRFEVLERLIKLADQPSASVLVRAAAASGVEVYNQEFLKQAEQQKVEEWTSEFAFRNMIRRRLKQYFDRPSPSVESPARGVVPPGSPIGN